MISLRDCMTQWPQLLVSSVAVELLAAEFLATGSGMVSLLGSGHWRAQWWRNLGGGTVGDGFRHGFGTWLRRWEKDMFYHQERRVWQAQRGGNTNERNGYRDRRHVLSCEFCLTV